MGLVSRGCVLMSVCRRGGGGAELYAMRGPGVHYGVAPPLPVRACLNEVRVAKARGYVYGSPRLCRSPLSVLWSVLVLGMGRTMPAGRRSWSPPLIPRPHAFDMGSPRRECCGSLQVCADVLL